MFKTFPERFTYPDIEHAILKYWDENKIFDKTLLEPQGKKVYSFYEGPPTVNGKPGIHHMMARTIKDTICRYKTMNGYYVRRQAGWDTHGLPVEIAMEKQLGLKDKSEIETYGMEAFNAQCKDFVYKNIEMDDGWSTLTHRMGYWVDISTAYITCTNNYIESVWWALKTYFEKGLIYRGFKVVPQSPTIATPLSSHELSLGYKDVRDPNCFIKLKVTDSKIKDIIGSEILVWTTTPWTLLANVATAVGEDIDYVHVRNTRKIAGADQSDNLILAKARLSVLDGEYEILGEMKGADLFGTRYEPIFPYLDIDLEEYPQAFTMLLGDFVSTSDGSGIVHLAPAFGEDDYEMSKKNKIPFMQPVTPNGHFTEDMGEFAGRAIKNFTYENYKEEGADKDIIIALKYAGKIYRATNDYLHSYPHCWRTGNPIMYYARESWFIKSPAYKERMIELNKEINWQPKEIGEGRFGNWLEEVKDWNLSRDRYWGTPLPIWVNEDDNTDFFAVGSIEELRDGFIEHSDGNLEHLRSSDAEIDLHRPFVDKIIFQKNGNIYRRVHEVIDVWFDSGAMPFAQFHYPFENEELFNEQFPADFIAEGIDQTRGWFYTLHNIAVALFDKPAFKNIIVNELILDMHGLKMSKSKGNVIDPFEIMDRLGADAVRWYLYVNNPPWKATMFNEDDLSKTVISDFFRSLTNTYAFFALYANIDGFTGTEPEIAYEKKPEIDRWIISKANSLAKNFIEFMDEYEVTKAMRSVQEFTINELSNWYIRRNRRRFWKGEKDDEKIAAYQTLKQVLKIVASVMAPAAPFLSEDIYLKLRTEDEPLSIHLCRMHEVKEEQIDLALEEKMSKAQQIVSLARFLREKSKIRVRQPLRRILLPVDNPQERRDIQSIADIIMEEINIKAIDFINDDTSSIVSKKAKGNFKTIGKKFGKSTQIVANAIKEMTSQEVNALSQNGTFELRVDGETYEILPDDVEVFSEDIEGWLVASENGVTVALDTALDEALLREGLAREFVSRLQNLRKSSGLEVTDRISLRINCSEDVKSSIAAMEDYIKNEILADSLEFVAEQKDFEIVEIEEHELFVEINKK